MERAFGLEMPSTLEEVCDPGRMALLVTLRKWVLPSHESTS